MTPAEVIRGARDLLFERGWHRGSAVGPDGSVCLEVGLSQASPNWEAYQAAARVVSVLIDSSIPAWNDDPSRHFNDVIDVLDRAEKFAEQIEVGATR